MVELLQESYGKGAKVIIDGRDATWAAGEQIYINATTATIQRSDGHAYIDHSAVGNTNYALYPASLATTASLTSSTTIALPHSYHYRCVDGHQILELPMAAYSTDDETPLLFRHLGGAICLTISNTTGDSLTIDSLTVSSNAYLLSGNRNIDFTNLTTIAPVATDADADRSITMLFDFHPLRLGHGDTCNVVIPIMPVGDDNLFTVNVTGHRLGIRRTFHATQSSGGSVERNYMAYATAPMSPSLPEDNLFAFREYSGYNCFVIASRLDLMIMAEAINGGYRTVSVYEPYYQRSYLIDNNIDMSGLCIQTLYQSDIRARIFGNGHTISNLTIDSYTIDENTYCGLYRHVVANTSPLSGIHFATSLCAAGATTPPCS